MKRSKHIAPAAVVLLLSVYYFCGAALFFSLIIAALVHELGHIAAIKICGGRLSDFSADFCGFSICGTGISSLPEEIFILLSGPSAGIILAMAMSSNNAFGSMLGEVSLLLSAYNLLPALPLDGGRAVFTLLESTFGIDCAERVMDALGMIIGTAAAFSGALLSKSALLIAGIWILIAQTGIVKNMRVL